MVKDYTNDMFYVYGLRLTIIGKVSQLLFKANIHCYSSVYWFVFNLTLYLNIILF
jgi:hypothetical protein